MMAYFANGSEGSYLDGQCYECIHKHSEFDGCPIAFVQMHFNYEQNDNEQLEQAINFLVDKDGDCQMKPIIEKLYTPKKG